MGRFLKGLEESFQLRISWIDTQIHHRPISHSGMWIDYLQLLSRHYLSSDIWCEVDLRLDLRRAAGSNIFYFSSFLLLFSPHLANVKILFSETLRKILPCLQNAFYILSASLKRQKRNLASGVPGAKPAGEESELGFSWGPGLGENAKTSHSSLTSLLGILGF